MGIFFQYDEQCLQSLGNCRLFFLKYYDDYVILGVKFKCIFSTSPEDELYLLRGEILAPNRDQQRQEAVPPNSLLELVHYEIRCRITNVV
jgi:hypothetical protein